MYCEILDSKGKVQHKDDEDEEEKEYHCMIVVVVVISCSWLLIFDPVVKVV